MMHGLANFKQIVVYANSLCLYIYFPFVQAEYWVVLVDRTLYYLFHISTRLLLYYITLLKAVTDF